MDLHFKTKLFVNDKNVVCLDLPRDNTNPAKNRYTIRQWLRGVKLQDTDHVKIIIQGEDDAELSRLDLSPINQNGKTIFTRKNDTGKIYSWGTLTPGYSGTVGFTSGIMLRKSKRGNEEPEE